jgi:hypothetical protein
VKQDVERFLPVLLRPSGLKLELKKMNMLRCIVILIVLSFGSIKLQAQYDKLRSPQTKEEIDLLQKNKVMGQTVYLMDKGQKLASEGRAYDRSGRIIGMILYNKRDYFLYDEQGRLVDFMDSVLNGENFVAKHYTFAYDSSGKLSFINLPDASVSFSYDKKSRTLTEKLSRNDSVFRTTYTYNKFDKPLDIKCYDVDGKLYKRHSFSYTDNGFLYSERMAVHADNVLDSVVNIYQYDGNNRVAERQVFTFNIALLKDAEKGPYTRQAEHYDSEDYLYTYNKDGRLASEERKVKSDPLSYYYRTFEYDSRGLMIKSSDQVAKMEPRFYVYEYAYFD